jgi:hypothetical protein
VSFSRDRVEAQEKMVLLNEKADKDIQQHNAEMKELVRIIDHDRKLREFMNTKTREREEDKQLVLWRTKKGWPPLKLKLIFCVLYLLVKNGGQLQLL